MGGGSNAIGLFHEFLADAGVEMVGVEAGGRGLEPGRARGAFRAGLASASCTARGRSILQDDDGQILPTHSVSAGLDYPAVGPEHARLAELGRTRYVSVSDAEALAAFHRLAETEGIIPALETAHAVAWAIARGAAPARARRIVVNLSGRGDKDVVVRREARGGGACERRLAPGVRAGEGGGPGRARRLRRGGRPRPRDDAPAAARRSRRRGPT